jgi:hypothetical protein
MHKFTTTIIRNVEVAPRDPSEPMVEFRGELERREEQVSWFEAERLPAMLERHLETAAADDSIRRLVGAGRRDEALRQLAATNGLWQKYVRERDELRATGPKDTLTVQVSSEGLPKPWHDADERGFPHFYDETYHLRRGDVSQKQDVVTQGFLPVLMRGGVTKKHWQLAPPAGWRTSYRRTALANWLADDRYGAGQLAARVIVNRVWQHHFGRGIVATPNDFGKQGERPTHPELLDWLANELIHGGWRLKPIHKLIMTSRAYMQSSAWNASNAQVDPQNHYFWRQNSRRLEAESIRDAMLEVSGMLDASMFGPGTLDAGMYRRSIYFRIKRSRVVPILQAFDLPEPLTSQAQRSTTTVAPQALTLMNSPIVRHWAENLAEILRADMAESFTAAVIGAYRAALQRDPTAGELNEGSRFLQEQVAMYREHGKGGAVQTAFADFCQAILCFNELVYVE